jgi:Cu(I)/Ag(I) efflux system membrane fusion protein
MNHSFKNIIPQDRKSRIIWFAVIIFAFLIGWFLNSGDSSDPYSNNHTAEQATATSSWTCSMHPQIQQPGPGKCPICGMDLIPVKSDQTGTAGPRQLTLSTNARKLAEIEVSSVERKFVINEIRMVGKIDFDETRLSYITAWIPGRIDRLFVNYTGITVKKGDHLVELYSPELLSTQQELFESLKNLEAAEYSSIPEMKEISRQQLNSVRERLRLWGLSESQVSKIEKSGKPSEHITIYSPVSGVVVNKNALEGTYVNTGTQIYTIADLSKVWVKMDAYESDLPWLRYGQEVQFRTETYPGEVFKGKIAFIDPVLDPKTRTAKIRVNLENPDGKLKPQMFVRAVVQSKIGNEGQVMDSELSGKWISPMHPEVVKNHPGKCDVCGMPLVRAEELGYMSVAEIKTGAPLVIPASAPLITGTRAVVYVAVKGKEGTYEGREIELGARANNYYIVKAGLSEGEKVVVKGNFKIDSAIQIEAKASMMNPGGGRQATGHQHSPTETPKKAIPATTAKKTNETISEIPNTFKKQLDGVYAAYFEIQFALSHDNFDSSKNKALGLLKMLEVADMKLLKGDAHMLWMESLENVKKYGTRLKDASNIETARLAFSNLSESLIAVGKNFGSDQQALLVYHCPMAFDNKGADWLQNKEGTENPYFGSMMFKCGSQIANLSSTEMKDMQEGHKHD